MANDTLSTELQFAQKSMSVMDEPTPVVEWAIPDGSELTLREGHPAIIDAETPGGDPVPNGARLGLAYREPNDPLDAYTVISDFSIAPFNQLSLRDQNSGDNAERRSVRFDPDRVPHGTITLSDSDRLALIALSSEQIDGTTMFFNYPMEFGEA